jgi:hypothetical protein
VSGVPSTSIEPDTGSYSRQSSFASVVLPAPLTPTIAIELPAGTCRSNPSSTRRPSSYANTTSRKRRSTGPGARSRPRPGVSAPARADRGLEPLERHHRCAGAVEHPAEPTERERRHTDRGLHVHHHPTGRQVTVDRSPGDQPEHEQVHRRDDREAAGHRLFAEPRGLELQVVQGRARRHEPVDHPSRQAEQPELLARRRVDGEAVRVLGVSLGAADVVGVAIAPHAALAEQPVGGTPAEQHRERRPPREPEQQSRRGDPDHHLHEPVREEVHRDRQRRAHHPEVEVAGHREIGGQLGPFEVADAVGAQRGRHQPVVQVGGHPLAEVGAQQLVQRVQHHRQREHRAGERERPDERAVRLDRRHQPPERDGDDRRHDAAQHDQHPPGGVQPGRGATERSEEPHLLPLAERHLR